MNPGITEWLSTEQLQQFDVDSIKEVIKKYEETKELTDFNIDWNDSLSLEEIEIFNQLEKTWDILDWLNQIIKEIEKRKIEKKETSIFENIFWDKETISSKNIEDYSKEESKKVLEYLNINYKNYSDSISSSLDSITENISSTDNLENIDTKTEVNIFQEKLINKIIWNNKWYSWDYLQWYNNKEWNFLVNMSDFSSYIQTIKIENINSKVLVNFFKLLTNEYRINILELKALFWERQLSKLKEYWNSDKSNNIAKNYLLENNLWYIIEMMDKDLDYYSSLSKEELEIKLKIVTDENEKIRIKSDILLLQVNEKIEILKLLNYDKNELKKIKNQYEKSDKTDMTKKILELRNYDNTLQLRIQTQLEKKSWISKNSILKQYWVEEIFLNDNKIKIINGIEIDTVYNIKTEELLNKLINITDINQVILIISELNWQNLLDLDLYENKLIDKYLEKITKEWTISQKTELIKNLSLFRSQNLCPSSNVVIELKKSIIINNKMTNYIKNQIDNMYPNWENLWEELINSIKEKMDNSKEWKKYCTIDIASIIIEFDKKHLDAKKDWKPITKNEIKKLIEWTLQLEKEQINNKISAILEKAWQIWWWIMSAYKISEKKLNLKSLNIWNNSNNFTFIANLTLRELTIGQINNLWKITQEEKEILLQAKKDLKQVDIAQKNYYSFSDKEFTQIIQWIKDWKKTEDIKKEIEKNRHNNISNSSNENNQTSENTFSKTDSWYNIKWENWKTIEWLIISEEEKNLITKNPEAKENLIKFYEFFKELNLESVWKYRKELLISIWNRNINFKDNNSISKTELIQFWNNLILALNNLTTNNKELNKKPKLFITNSLSWVQNELRKFSWSWSILSDEKTYNINWEDKFAATLRNFWIIWWAYFKINTFRKQIKK